MSHDEDISFYVYPCL